MAKHHKEEKRKEHKDGKNMMPEKAKMADHKKKK